MKYVATFALVVLLCGPAKAQYGGMGGMGGRAAAQAQTIELELLEMEQEADKAALKEAFLAQARHGMKPAAGLRQEEKQALDEEITALHAFIAGKKEAITARAAAKASTSADGTTRNPMRRDGKSVLLNEPI